MRTRSRTSGPLLLLFTLLSVQGCESPSQKQPVQQPELVEQQADVSEALDTGYESDPNLSLPERFRLFLTLLDTGDPVGARVELLAYLEQRPESEVANNLLMQLEMASGEYFPSDYFEVTLKSGETLSTLAMDYLGDVYQYYALAKYNHIARPNSISLGDVIRIPLTDNAKKVRAGVPIEVRTGELMTEAPAAGSVSDFSEPAFDDPVVTDTADDLMPEQDISADAQPLEVAMIEPEETEPAGLSVPQQIEQLLEEGDLEAATVLLEEGIGDDDSEVVEALKTRLADAYHFRAAIAYRGQELDKAINLWDMALAIDPEHKNANIFRAQAIELRDRLSTLQ